MNLIEQPDNGWMTWGIGLASNQSRTGLVKPRSLTIIQRADIVELIKDLFLRCGFQIGWPANLMTIGPYQEPLAPFLPSLAY